MPDVKNRSGQIRHGEHHQISYRSSARWAGLLMVMLTIFVWARPAAGQLPTQNQMAAYLDDSTRGSETLAQLDQMIRVGSIAEAARTLQSLLDTEGDRVVVSPLDPQLFIPLRDAIHAALLGRPELLRSYVRQQGPPATRALELGDHAGVERTRFLTTAGYEATLRVAQDHLEAARFSTAWRTVRQLESHPDHKNAEFAAEAAGLAATISRYLPADHEVSIAAKNWAIDAGVPVLVFTPAGKPNGLLDSKRVAVPTEAPHLQPPDLSGIVGTPLSVVTLPIAGPWAAQSSRTATRRTFWALPAILDNLTIINDGEAITAYDRFTLRSRWSFPVRTNTNAPTADADRSRNRTRLIEDPTTITVHRGRVLAAMGTVISGRREGDPSIVCLDAGNGNVLWRVRPDQLGPETTGSSVRGPIAVFGETVIVMLRRNERSRRTISVALAGLDLNTGVMKWHRFVGSVGALPYQQQTRSPQAVAIIEGVAYATDEIGIITAVDAESGRPVWIRRTPALGADTTQTKPWAVHTPLPSSNGGVLTISPDRAALLNIDRRTGVVTQQRPTAQPGLAAYLVALDGEVAVLDANGLVVLDSGDITRTITPRIQIPPSRGPIVGRAVATRDALYAPVKTGVFRIPQGEPELGFIPLDHAGNIDIAQGQLIAADDTWLRSYLVWDTASELLIKRAEADPENPDHAVTFAELAHRAGRMDEVVPAIDRAIRVVSRTTGTPASREASGRLFDSILDMVNAAQRGDAENKAPAVHASFTDDLLDRLDRLADSPAQRVAHLLAMGLQQERTADAAEAIVTYQRILADSALANTAWRGDRLSVRAELETTRRLQRVAAEAGTGVYAGFAAEANTALAALAGSPVDPPALDRLARRYPLAPAAIKARMAEAAALRGRGLNRDAVIAGNAAVELLRRQILAGIPIGPELVGEAFGVHIAALADANRIEEAAALLAEVSDAHPDVLLRDPSGPVDSAALFKTISQRLAARRTGPRLGTKIIPDEKPQLIKGYALRPLARPEPRGVARARFDGTLFVAKQGGLLAWYHTTSRDGPLEPAWTREIDRDPILLRTDEVSAWIFWPDETGGWLERTDLADGTPMWTSLSWTDLVRGVDTPEPEVEANDRFLDPLTGRVRRGEILVVTGARTLVFVERGGRAIALDAATGQRLWAKPIRVSRVHDADLAAGVLAIAGIGRDAAGSLGPLMTAIDPRTGETIYSDDRLPSNPRWVRVTESGHVLAGLRDRVVSAAPFESRMNWELNDEPLLETREAWLNGSELLIRADDDALWRIDTESGRLSDAPLDTRGRIDSTDRIVVRKTPSRLILAASDGVCVFTSAGELAGLDAFGQPARLLPAIIAENTLAVLKIERGRFGIGGSRFVVHLMSKESARVTHDAVVTLFGDPTDLQAIDGRLLVTAGDLTEVIRIPLDEK